jgi:hypothetical protein
LTDEFGDDDDSPIGALLPPLLGGRKEVGNNEEYAGVVVLVVVGWLVAIEVVHDDAFEDTAVGATSAAKGGVNICFGPFATLSMEIA